MNKLDPGDYSYAIVVRDYTNKTQIYYEELYKFTIDIPFIYYVGITAAIMIIGIASISIFYSIYKLKEFNNKYRESTTDLYN